MSANMVGLAIIILAIFLLIGKGLRSVVPVFYKFFIPSSIIGGFLLLFLGPEVLGAIISDERFAYGLFNEPIIEVFKVLPGILITVIFAGLFLGKKTPTGKAIFRVSGPQLAYAQSAAWGQYVVGILVTMLFLVPLFDAQPMVGALIEIGFEGGHGTAAGLASTFDDMGFSEGTDIALGLATIGVVSGLMIGVFLINYGVRHNHTAYLTEKKDIDSIKRTGIIPINKREKTMSLSVSTESIEPLAMHLGLFAVAILVGIGFLESLKWFESVTWARNDGIELFAHIPLFPLAMLGGVVVQVFVNKFDKYNLFDRKMIERIQGLALDILIVSAIAGLSLSVIANNLGIFLTLAIVGIIWNLFVFMVLARHMIPKYWFERGIGDYGQSMGMTAVGLILIRIVDSDNKTPSLEAFGYKQLLFEPLVGGGLVTAMSVPLIYNFGPWPLFIVASILMVISIIVGIFYFGRLDPKTQDELKDNKKEND